MLQQRQQVSTEYPQAHDVPLNAHHDSTQKPTNPTNKPTSKPPTQSPKKTTQPLQTSLTKLPKWQFWFKQYSYMNHDITEVRIVNTHLHPSLPTWTTTKLVNQMLCEFNTIIVQSNARQHDLDELSCLCKNKQSLQCLIIDKHSFDKIQVLQDVVTCYFKICDVTTSRTIFKRQRPCDNYYERLDCNDCVHQFTTPPIPYEYIFTTKASSGGVLDPAKDGFRC